ncbi:MAG: hypothetical protein OEV61_04270 [Chloroflexota bacterium]|jgi:uncharacterized membrane protein|nr:hypothetical protein [Chloroflexota bacterium]MDH5243162.1 hypothetical protein [Chloroflexota bacterium]
MGCLFVMFGAVAPRAAVFILWLARPAYVDAAFDTFLWPLLGILFFPFTTLMYLLVFTPGVGMQGNDWIWVAIAFVLDIGQLAATATDRRYQSGWRNG